LNAILTTSAPTMALSKAKQKTQLRSSLHPYLRLNISPEPILATELTPWALEVKEHDNQMQVKDACTQKLIDASASACTTCCIEKKDLLSQLADPPTMVAIPTKTHLFGCVYINQMFGCFATHPFFSSQNNN
jgi:hypothetical protein